MLRWPLREGLLRYAHLMREWAREDYRFQVLTWAPQSPYLTKKDKPPEVPRILKR